MKGILIGMLCSIPIWILFIWLLACSSANRVAQPTLSDFLFTAQVNDVLLTSRAKVYGATVSTTCRPKSGSNPWAYVPDQRPIAGKPILCSFVSSFVQPRPVVPFIVAVSQTLLPESLDLTPFGAPGCRLLIPIDQTYIIAAEGDKVGPFTYSAPGRVDFKLETNGLFSGQKLYLQAGIFAPGENQAGLLTTQAVEFWIR